MKNIIINNCFSPFLYKSHYTHFFIHINKSPYAHIFHLQRSPPSTFISFIHIHLFHHNTSPYSYFFSSTFFSSSPSFILFSFIYIYLIDLHLYLRLFFFFIYILCLLNMETLFKNSFLKLFSLAST